MKCLDCKFFTGKSKTEDGKVYGYCFRYPPHLLQANQSGSVPVDAMKGWCGEYKPKRTAKK